MTPTWTKVFLLEISTIPKASGTVALHVETLMQNFPAFTSAAETKPCATECAITPSAAFKTKYACDPADPVSCICANRTRSVELRESMSTHCYQSCDGFLGPQLATAILSEYCGQSWEGTSTITTTTRSPETSSWSTGTGSPGPSDPPGDGGLTRAEVIVLQTVIPIVGTLVAAVTAGLGWRKYVRDKRKRSANDDGTELAERTTDTS